MAGSRTVGDLQTPYEDAVISGVDQGGVDTSPRGGRAVANPVSGPGLVSSPFDEPVMPSLTNQGETPNTASGLALRVDGVRLGAGDPGEGGTIAIPNLDQDNTGRTID